MYKNIYNFQIEQSIVETESTNNKRSLGVEDLFGNLDDIDFENEECEYYFDINWYFSVFRLPCDNLLYLNCPKFVKLMFISYYNCNFRI